MSDDETTTEPWMFYRDEICRGWVKSVQSILDLCKTCAEAYDKLGPHGFHKLTEQVPFSASKLSILCAIGRDERLHKKPVLRRLPACYSTMYQVHLLNDDELNTAVDSGLLQPDVKREHIEKLRLKRGYSKFRQAAKAQVTDEKSLVQGAKAEVAVEESPHESYANYMASRLVEPPPPTMEVLGELLVPSDFSDYARLHEEIMILVLAYEIEFVPKMGTKAKRLQSAEVATALYKNYCASMGIECSGDKPLPLLSRTSA